MNILHTTKLLNEEKLKSEAAIALFNALGPNHLETAREYKALADIQSDLEKNEEALENYSKALPTFLAANPSDWDYEIIEVLYDIWIYLCNTEDIKGQSDFLTSYFEKLENYIKVYNDSGAIYTDYESDEELDEDEEYDEDERVYLLLLLYQDILTTKLLNFNIESEEFLAAEKAYTDNLITFVCNEVDILLGCKILLQYYLKTENISKIYMIDICLLMNNDFDDIEFAKNIIGLFLDSTLEENFLDEKGQKTFARVKRNFNKNILKVVDIEMEEITDFVKELLQPLILEFITQVLPNCK